MTEEDLFGGHEPPRQVVVADSGVLVTNHLNLFYMLSAGLLLPPAGFDGKHYDDTLGCFPGWIPLFLSQPSLQAISQSTAEAQHLKPVLVEVSLTDLTGRILACRQDGTAEIDFPAQLSGSEDLLLIPAPLPTSRIKSIIYLSADERRSCEADAGDYGNVPINDFKGRSSKTLFTKGRKTGWPPRDGPKERAVPLQTANAAGGVMAMLLHYGNLGELAEATCRSAFDPDESSMSRSDHILDGVGVWMKTGFPPSFQPDEDGSVRHGEASGAYLFWGAVEKLLEWRHRGRADAAEDVLLRWLVDVEAMLDSPLQPRIRALRDSLASLRGLASATTSELFERHPTPMGRAMALFFLRDGSVDLLGFDHDALHEPDWLMAAVLFGVRDGWLALPLRLRVTPGLSAAVSHRMARMAHRSAGSELSIGEPPPRTRTLREILVDNPQAALDLARRQKWDCINTRVSLGRGEYQLVVAGGSAHVDMAGEPKVDSRVDLARFLRCLAESRLDPKTESKVRASLRG